MTPAWRVLSVWAVLYFVTAAYSGFGWHTVLSCALSIAVLTLVVLATGAAGWRLVWMLFLLYFGIAWLNTLDEAVLFRVLPGAIAFQSLAHGVTTTFTVAVLLALALNRLRIEDKPLSADFNPRFPASWIWKIAGGALVYSLFYLVAGAIINPYIEAFYSGRWLPSLGTLIVIQFFRGLLYIGVALPFIGSMSGRWLQAGIVLGLCYSVLGGIAPLLLSNAYMPPAVRLAHSMEVGVSNFLFGMALSYLLVSRTGFAVRAADALPDSEARRKTVSDPPAYARGSGKLPNNGHDIL